MKLYLSWFYPHTPWHLYINYPFGSTLLTTHYLARILNRLILYVFLNYMLSCLKGGLFNSVNICLGPHPIYYLRWYCSQEGVSFRKYIYPYLPYNPCLILVFYPKSSIYIWPPLINTLSPATGTPIFCMITIHHSRYSYTSSVSNA